MHVKTLASPAARPNVAPMRPPVASADSNEPKDKVEKGPSEAGDFVQKSVGGLTMLGLAIPAMYAGVLGGAVVGTMLGAGFSPVLSSVTTSGAGNFLLGVWHGTSFAAKAGMFLGGSAGLAGALSIGAGVGRTVGRIFGGEGGDGKPNRKLNALGSAAAFVTTGIGAAAGTTGGALIGAGVGATGSFLAQGFSFSNLGGAAGIGALAGGAVGLMTGSWGGYKLTTTANNILGWAADKGKGAVDVVTEQHKPKETK